MEKIAPNPVTSVAVMVSSALKIASSSPKKIMNSYSYSMGLSRLSFATISLPMVWVWKTVGPLSDDPGLSVPWSLRPRKRTAAAIRGRGHCDYPAILKLTRG